MNKSTIYRNKFSSVLEAEEDIKDFLLHKAAPQPVKFKLFWALAGDVSQCHRNHADCQADQAQVSASQIYI